MIINRSWAMPNKNTFKIKPIRLLVERYCKDGLVIVEPFANSSTYGTIRNDLNPAFDTHYHLDAEEFFKIIPPESADVVLYDPPFSISQAKIAYDSFGGSRLGTGYKAMEYWAHLKNEVSRIIKPGGVVIICGWSTNGCGLKRGFEMTEILLVPHGGSKNDTIVTVEIKL
jgi:hypothetical protein